MIAVPAFAEGIEGSPLQQTTRIKLALKRSGQTPTRMEFLTRYQVIGILKLEGKKPCLAAQRSSPEWSESLAGTVLTDHEVKSLDLANEEKREINRWWDEGVRLDGESILQKAFPPFLIERKEMTEEEKRKALVLRKAFADAFTQHYHAEFTRDDMELLVLLAMQVGRVLTRRTVLHAAQRKIILSENEIGLLGIQWEDVDQLRDLRHAAHAAMRKVAHDLEALSKELDAEQRKTVYRARVSQFLDPHGPIRSIEARCKGYNSLIHKLVRKEREKAENPYPCEVDVHVPIRFDDRNSIPDQRRVARGYASVFLDRPIFGSMRMDLLARFETEGRPSMLIRESHRQVAVGPSKDKEQPVEPPVGGIPGSGESCAPLIARMLDAATYAVDDLAGVRVIADYSSDIDVVLEEIRARVREWNMKIEKVDDWRRGRERGYRAVHLIVQVNVANLVPEEVERNLLEGLRPHGDKPLFVPVEIQLRTAYQHSWALKTHAISYKRESQIPEGLLDEQEILSNVLSEADRLSDIVRGNIATTLLPTDYGEGRLLQFLARRVSREDLTIIKFGIACAKEVLKNRLRYNGEPEYSFAVEACQWLVYSFGQTDPYMLLVALLQSIWQIRQPEHGIFVPRGRWQGSVEQENAGSTKHVLRRLLQEHCDRILARFRGKLMGSLSSGVTEDWFTFWLAQAPGWFWAIQESFRSYYSVPLDDQVTRWKERLHLAQDELERLGVNRPESDRDKEQVEQPNPWLEHVYVIEAAILLASLTELPMEPGRVRRARLYRDYLSLFREIRKRMPNGSVKPIVIAEIDRALRDLETRLDLARESEWWSD